MAGDFFVRAKKGWLGPGSWGTFSNNPQWGSRVEIVSPRIFTVLVWYIKRALGFEEENLIKIYCLAKMFSTNLDIALRLS